jgi:DNA polymerase III alpha subunit
LRTEYNFGRAYGPISKVVARIKQLGHKSAGIADVGTWGHVAFYNECISAGIKPILGAEIPVVADATLRERQPANFMAFIARNNDGLRELYELVTLSTSNFYYIPRIDYNAIAAITDNIIILSGTNPNLDLLQPKRNLYIECSYLTSKATMDFGLKNDCAFAFTADNYYPTAEDKIIYEIMLHKDRDNYTFPMHIPDSGEMGYTSLAQDTTDRLAEECNVDLPQAQMVRFKCTDTLEAICRKAIPERCSAWNDSYEKRLVRELQLIKEKDYEDYFYVLWDALKYAKQHMLVGPARGSSCGSLVCYLLGITEIDPLPYGLLFERFIDVTRKDLPDVDIDFADDRRDMVFSYLEEKYGADCVARLGTISRYKAKSAISTVAKSTLVPETEVAELKNRIIERSTGDSRAKFCIIDTFNELDVGKVVLSKYPHMRYAGDLEQHASHSGQHAAGIVVTQHPVTDYCSLDKRTGALQVDKYDAEKLNLLKIDALGLRTLSILQDILDQVGQPREWLYKLPTDDPKAFKILNDKRYAGIFQFEGFALQSFCSQMVVENFEDYASITSLARPGPLNSGGATNFVERRSGKKPIEYLHASCEEYTRGTYGVVIYQEQVMQIVRNVGKLSWEDTSTLRKAMSKSYGVEYFDQFWQRFKKGAEENGVVEKDARHIWDHVNSMGSWSFNRSHAVAYGLLSYWCCYLKAYHPLQFALANLRHAKDDAHSIRMLREFVREGFAYVPVDRDASEINWSLQSGVLVGGLTAIHGCGIKKAQEIIKKRKNKEPFTPGQIKMLNNPTTPWDDVFECRTKWGHIKQDPAKYNLETKIMDIADITGETQGDFLVFGKLKEKNLRDMNEAVNLMKRGGKKVTTNNLWLNIMVEDDTGSIICRIDRYHYEQWGKPIVESMAEDEDWLLIKGQVSKGFRLIVVEKYRHLTKKVRDENSSVKENVASATIAQEGANA